MGSRSKSNTFHSEIRRLGKGRINEVAVNLGWTIERIEELQRGATPSAKERKHWQLGSRLPQLKQCEYTK